MDLFPWLVAAIVLLVIWRSYLHGRRGRRGAPAMHGAAGAADAGASAAVPPNERVEKTFEADRLDLRALYPFEVDVAVSEAKEMRVSATGPVALLKLLRFEVKDGALVATRRGAATVGESIVIETVNGVERIMLNGEFVGHGPLRCAVTVPRGTDVRIAGSMSAVRVGDTDGRLAIASVGMGAITVGKVTEFTVNHDGGGAVNIKSAEAASHLIHYSGMGALRVGRIKSGVLTINAGAMGNLKLPDVDVGYCELNMSGMGNVSVEGNVTELDLRSSAMGNATFRGKVARAAVRAEGMGNVTLPRGVEVIEGSHTGMGVLRTW